MIDSLNFSTSPFVLAERFSRYRDFYSAGADAVQLSAPVTAQIEAWRLGGLILYDRKLTGVGSERLVPRVRRNQFDHFTLQINLGGEFHADPGGGFRAVQPGEILLLDMARPMRTRFPDVHLITLTLPRTVVEAVSDSIDALHGLVLPKPQAGPLTAFLLSSIQRIGLLDGDDMQLNEALTHLLGEALDDMGLGAAARRDAIDDERLVAARRFVRQHLSEEALSPARIARATGISRATLYRLFDEEGGVRKYIQEKRLAQFKRSLSNPHLEQSISLLAYEAGFADESHASRTFRKEFGQPPSRFRRDMRLAGQSIFGDEASATKVRMQMWYSHLDL